jgi:hypothetical protein
LKSPSMEFPQVFFVGGLFVSATLLGVVLAVLMPVACRTH